jgi:hypothetical protein
MVPNPHQPSADFRFGQGYQLVYEQAHEVYVVEDADQRLVAVAPVGLGGQVETRTDRWLIQSESRKIGWAVVAHNIPDHSEAGSVREGLLPDTCKLHVAPDFEGHVTANPLNGHWTISEGRSHLFRITDAQRFASAGRDGQPKDRALGATIATLEAPRKSVPLALAIFLTLEMIKADAAIPLAGDGGASMIF